MKSIKKLITFAVIMLIQAGHMMPMDPPMTKRLQKKILNTIPQIIRNLDPSAELSQIVQATLGKRKIETNPQTFPFFTQLPQDVQNIIKDVIISGETATTIEEAAEAIYSLSRVNNDFNSYINKNKECSEIIKSLAQRFNISDMEVCNVLKLPRIKKQLNLQNNVMMLSGQKSYIKYKELDRFVELGVDFNFIYNHSGQTLLSFAIQRLNFPLVKKLLKLGADPTFINNQGQTPLEHAQASMMLPQINNQTWVKIKNILEQYQSKK